MGSYSCRFTTGTIPTGGYSELVVKPYVTGIAAGTQYNISADVNAASRITPDFRTALAAFLKK